MAAAGRNNAICLVGHANLPSNPALVCPDEQPTIAQEEIVYAAIHTSIQIHASHDLIRASLQRPSPMGRPMPGNS